jgi:hypothetical protein
MHSMSFSNCDDDESCILLYNHAVARPQASAHIRPPVHEQPLSRRDNLQCVVGPVLSAPSAALVSTSSFVEVCLSKTTVSGANLSAPAAAAAASASFPVVPCASASANCSLPRGSAREESIAIAVASTAACVRPLCADARLTLQLYVHYERAMQICMHALIFICTLHLQLRSNTAFILVKHFLRVGNELIFYHTIANMIWLSLSLVQSHFSGYDDRRRHHN